MVVERWTAAGRVEHYADLARDVAQTQPDVIVAPSDQLLIRLKAATTAPIVGITADPVAVGSRGESEQARRQRDRLHCGPDAVVGKRLEFLREAIDAPVSSRHGLRFRFTNAA